MDLETENRIAAILLREAAELHRQAEREGVQAYLHQPKNRGRPNSRFLTATVLGVQQSNRAVEENEMWRARHKELELDNQLRRRTRDGDSCGKSDRRYRESGRHIKRQFIEVDADPSCSSRKRGNAYCYSREDEELKDGEVEEFLHSRIKRGRGAVGSRMDETGPYLPANPETREKQVVAQDLDSQEWKEKHVLGPSKTSFIVSKEDSEDVSCLEKKQVEKPGASKQSPRKHKSKDKSRSRDKRKKTRMREEKRRKHRKQ